VQPLPNYFGPLFNLFVHSLAMLQVVISCDLTIVAATHTDMSPEVVEFRNIGCGQYISCFTSHVDMTLQLDKVL